MIILQNIGVITNYNDLLSRQWRWLWACLKKKKVAINEAQRGITTIRVIFYASFQIYIWLRHQSSKFNVKIMYLFVSHFIRIKARSFHEMSYTYSCKRKLLYRLDLRRHLMVNLWWNRINKVRPRANKQSVFLEHYMLSKTHNGNS